MPSFLTTLFKIFFLFLPFDFPPYLQTLPPPDTGGGKIKSYTGLSKEPAADVSRHVFAVLPIPNDETQQKIKSA